jgi:hypothetical protein
VISSGDSPVEQFSHHPPTEIVDLPIKDGDLPFFKDGDLPSGKLL